LRLKTEVSVSRIWPQFLHIVHLNSSNLLLWVMSNGWMCSQILFYVCLVQR
jgi:hypothetical protein